MAVSRLYRSATQGRATTAISACGNTVRMARIAGSDMTASPSQLVARTITREKLDGLKTTHFQHINGGCTVSWKDGVSISGELPAARGSGKCHRGTHPRSARRRTAPGAAGRHRLGQDIHHGQGHRGDGPAGADSGAQQDSGRAALSRIPHVLPGKRRRIFRELLRLLSAGSLHSQQRCLHRERRHHQ